jgi:hypothetical protein
MSQIAHIDCGFLATVQAKADARWLDPIKNIDMIASATTAKAVLENQSVKLGELQDKNKKLVVSLEWLTDCDATTTDCSDDCTIDGADASPVCKEYEVTCLQEATFKVADRAYRERTIDAPDSIAFLLEMKKKMLDEWIAQYILTALHTNVGTNVYTGGVGTVAGSTTSIPAAAWNDNIWGYFDLVSRMNKFGNAYGITGTNLYQLIFNRSLEAGNADGKGNFAKMNTLKMYLDPENVETIAANHTFLLHKNAAAFVGKAWYPLGGANAVELMPGQMAWSENSRNLPGVSYDVITKRTCVSNEYYTAFKVQLHGTFALNPTPCSETNTGILQFACV